MVDAKLESEVVEASPLILALQSVIATALNEMPRSEAIPVLMNILVRGCREVRMPKELFMESMDLVWEQWPLTEDPQ